MESRAPFQIVKIVNSCQWYRNLSGNNGHISFICVTDVKWLLFHLESRPPPHTHTQNLDQEFFFVLAYQNQIFGRQAGYKIIAQNVAEGLKKSF